MEFKWTASVQTDDQPRRHGGPACSLLSSAAASPSANQGRGETAASQGHAGNIQDEPRASWHLRAKSIRLPAVGPSVQCGACVRRLWATGVHAAARAAAWWRQDVADSLQDHYLVFEGDSVSKRGNLSSFLVCCLSHRQECKEWSRGS